MAATIQRVNFEVISDYNKVERRDFPLNDPTLCDPSLATALVDGEYLSLNDSRKLVRSADISQAAGTVAGAPGSYRTMAWLAAKGRTDVMANAANKGPVVFLGAFEAQTRVFDAAYGTGITAVNQPLKVAVIADASGNKYSGLIRHTGPADNDPVEGYVTRLPGADGYLWYVKGTRNFGTA